MIKELNLNSIEDVFYAKRVIAIIKEEEKRLKDILKGFYEREFLTKEFKKPNDFNQKTLENMRDKEIIKLKNSFFVNKQNIYIPIQIKSTKSISSSFLESEKLIKKYTIQSAISSKKEINDIFKQSLIQDDYKNIFKGKKLNIFDNRGFSLKAFEDLSIENKLKLTIEFELENTHQSINSFMDSFNYKLHKKNSMRSDIDISIFNLNDSLQQVRDSVISIMNLKELDIKLKELREIKDFIEIFEKKVDLRNFENEESFGDYFNTKNSLKLFIKEYIDPIFQKDILDENKIKDDVKNGILNESYLNHTSKITIYSPTDKPNRVIDLINDIESSLELNSLMKLK